MSPSVGVMEDGGRGCECRRCVQTSLPNVCDVCGGRQADCEAARLSSLSSGVNAWSMRCGGLNRLVFPVVTLSTVTVRAAICWPAGQVLPEVITGLSEGLDSDHQRHQIFCRVVRLAHI